MDKYILVDHKAERAKDVVSWAIWFEKADRKVAFDQIGEIEVSTVFLGLDHSFMEGLPLLFETLVFGGPLDGAMERYSTWEEAEVGHDKMLKRVRDE